MTPPVLIALIWACGAESQSPDYRKKPTTSSDSAWTTSVTTMPTTSTLDCDAVPDQPLSITELAIETAEDFDFDASGNLVFADPLGGALLGTDSQLQQTVLATGVPDTRGISVLEDGRIAVAYFQDGWVGIVDPPTGGVSPLTSAISGPNALEVGDGVLYVTETGADPRVLEVDLATGAATTVARGLDYPNGLALDPTHQILYIADAIWGIHRVRRQPNGQWTEPEIVWDPPTSEAWDALAVDACGNLYLLGYFGGTLMRLDPEQTPAQPVVIAELDRTDSYFFNAMHWGSDRGGWRRDVLYVTDRDVVLAVELGFPGKDQPVDAAP